MMEAPVARYVGSTVADATAAIKALGVSVEVVGDGDTVLSQVPAKGSTIVKSKGKIILYTDASDSQAKTVTVPNVLGLSAAAANEQIINAGLNISVHGAQNQGNGAVVTSQSEAAGSRVPYGTVVKIEILHTDVTD